MFLKQTVIMRMKGEENMMREAEEESPPLSLTQQLLIAQQSIKGTLRPDSINFPSCA